MIEVITYVVTVRSSVNKIQYNMITQYWTDSATKVELRPNSNSNFKIRLWTHGTTLISPYVLSIVINFGKYRPFIMGQLTEKSRVAMIPTFVITGNTRDCHYDNKIEIMRTVVFPCLNIKHGSILSKPSVRIKPDVPSLGFCKKCHKAVVVSVSLNWPNWPIVGAHSNCRVGIRMTLRFSVFVFYHL